MDRYMDRYLNHDMSMAQWSPCNATSSPVARAPIVVSLAGADVPSAESRPRDRAATPQPAVVVFEYDSSPLEISPALAKVLLRILRKATEQRPIEIDGTVSPPS